MTDPITMSFSLNQAVLDQAIAAELPRLLKDLEIDYTSGREPKGLTAQVTLTEAMIRQAVTAYARKTVNASFSHFAIDFRATRGEDGIVANITASNAPIEGEEERPTRARASAAPAAEPEADTASAGETSPQTAEADQASAETDPAEAVADPAVAEAVEEAAPESDANDAPENTGAEEGTASGEGEKEDGAATAAPAPSAGRSKLFAGLSRPDNSKSE